MLSTENPPLDLPCPCEISQLQNTSTDERASDKNHHRLEVDLLKSGLDDEEDNNSTNPLPKFSIRDYVFDTRGKNIKNNWPFSGKNLQLCLKYGVKDVLPPFQSLDSVRNPSTEKCVTENFSYSDVKLSELSNCSVAQKLALDIENINSSKPEEDKEHPPTTRSQFCSDLNPVPQSTNPLVEQKSEYTPVKKVKSNTQNPIKKCRLILKSNKIVERKSNENLFANSSAASEATMTSKVCPVCKTFSSSSNTTLNAHIDQCLSGESTIKWTAANTKVIKHRIKPRKTKLMVDIYETALQCTLEDLDRRNGTNWASNLCFPAHVSKTCDEVNVGNSNEKGDVCIDSKSPKLRSLSKLNDLPSISAAKYFSGPSKLVEKDKHCKFVSGKKKRCLVQKLKLLKHPIYGQRSCSPIPDHSPEPEVNNGQIKQCLTSNDRMKSDNLGMIKPWVGSKRSGPKQKINLEHENQHPDKNVKYSKENGCPSEFLVPTPKPATESHKRKENLLCNSRYGSKEQPCQRKRPGFSSLMSPEFHVKKSYLVRKDRPSVHELNADPPNATQNNDFSRNNKKMRIDVNPAVNTNSSFISSRISQPRAFPSQGKESGSKKFSSLRKKLLSVRRTSVPESKNYGKKDLDFKKPCHNYTSGSDEEVVVSRSAINRQDNAGQMKRASDKPSINGTTVPKIRKKRRKLVKAGKGDVSLKDSEETSPEPDSDDVGKNVSSFVRELTYKIADGEDFIAFSKSLDSTFDRISGPSNVERVSQQEMFCSENAVRDLVAPAETDADEAKRNYFVDVDPIPIPGPPGSFLPSPRHMCSEDLQGNSSLTTCKIQSSENEHEVVDMDSSDSPISASSYSGSVVNLSAKSHDQNRTQCDIFEQAANAERELILEETKANSMCCCSRKDRAIQSGSLIFQDSQLLRRRTVTSPEKEKHVADVPKNRIHGSKLGYSETLNAANSPMGYAPVIASHNSEAKFVDYEFPGPSTPHNPVLRLMGKNLMVVSKDENQLSSPQTNPWFCADNDLSTCNNRSGPHSFDRSLPRGHSMFENSQANMPAQHFDFMKSPANYRPSQLPSPHPLAQMLSSKSTFAGSFVAPSPKYYENDGGYNLIHDQISGPNIMRSLDTGRMYHDTDAQLKTADPCGSKYKKIHCIETTEGSYVGITSSSSSSMESRYDHQRLVSHHPFYGYPVYNGHPSSMVQNNGNIQVPVSNGITNANLGKWNCSITPEGSSNLMHPNSLTAASLLSISHLRSSLYFSPGF